METEDIGSSTQEILGKLLATYQEKFAPRKTLQDVADEKDERAIKKQREVHQKYFIGFGPAFFNNLNASANGISLSPGIMWNIDHRFDLGLVADIAFSFDESDVKFLNPHVEARYHPLEKDISPYAGVGFGYAISTAHDDGGILSLEDSANGFSASAIIGLMLFRTSKVNLTTELAYSTIFAKNDYGYPSVTSFRVGVAF